jgi:glycosyltransferase involved in cell wall biosynthesis
MKILCMNYEYPPIGGGGANVAHPLAATLVARGHTVDVVTSGMRDLPAAERTDGVDVHRVRCVRAHRHYTTAPELMTYIWPAFKKALSLAETRQFDINHTHFALPSGLASYLLYRKTGLPYVTTIHGSDVPGYNPDRFGLVHYLVRPVWRKIIRNSAKIVSPSCHLADLIRKHIDVPVEVVPNGFAPRFTRGLTAEKQDRILVVTRMFPRKGVQFFLDALAGLEHGWEVVVAGDGPYLPALQEQARRLRLKVRFTGFVQGATLDELYRTSRIFVFPSLQENFPTVLLEAMEAGCAIITSRCGGCAEVIGGAGIATEPGQPAELRAALSALMADPARIAALGAHAKERIEQFRWPDIASRYEKLLEGALPSRPDVSLGIPATANAGDRK